jgi:hypothetical protein
MVNSDTFGQLFIRHASGTNRGDCKIDASILQNI